MQEDIDRFVKTTNPIAIWLILIWIGIMVVIGAIGAKRAWNEGGRGVALLFLLKAMGMGAIGIALLVAIFKA